MKKVKFPCGCVFFGEPHPSVNVKEGTENCSPVIHEMRLCGKHRFRLMKKVLKTMSERIASEFLKAYMVEIEVLPKTS